MSKSRKGKHRRGTGCVFMAGSETKWIRYFINGRSVTENARTTRVEEAQKLLAKRIYEAGEGIVPAPSASKVTLTSLYEDVERNYRIKKRKSIRDLKMRWRLHLEPVFGFMRPSNVTTDAVNRYIDRRQQEGASNGSVNRELTILKRCFTLGRKCTPPKVQVIPCFEMLEEDNVRTGFLEPSQYEALSRECAKFGLWMRALFELGYTYGWRREEIVGLRVNQISIIERTIRLNPGETKNNEGREVTLSPLLCQLLQECIRGKGPTDSVLTRDDASQVIVFRKTWAQVTKRAGVPELLFHDLRRTAVRNMVRAGISETVAMKISGHKTRSVFDRYNITSQADIREAIGKLVSQRTVRVEPEIAELPAVFPTTAARMN
jgi:integrase